jgi:hypothetical protein
MLEGTQSSDLGVDFEVGAQGLIAQKDRQALPHVDSEKADRLD